VVRDSDDLTMGIVSGPEARKNAGQFIRDLGGAPLEATTAGQQIRPDIRLAIDDVVEEIAGGKIEISTMDKIMSMGRGQLTKDEGGELAIGVVKALGQARDARLIDELQVGGFVEWLKNMGFGKTRGRAAGRAAGRIKPGQKGIVEPSERLGFKAAEVFESPQGDMVLWQGQEIGPFAGGPQAGGAGINLAHDFAAYLDEIAREGSVSPRILSGTEDILRASGYDESGVRVFHQWLEEATKEVATVRGKRASMVVEGPHGERIVTFDGDDIGATFRDAREFRHAKSIQEILEEVGENVPQRYESARRPIYKRLKDSGHSDDEAHGVLDTLDDLIEVPAEANQVYDDVAGLYDVDVDGIALGRYLDVDDARDVRYLIEDFQKTLRERPLKRSETDELENMVAYLSDDLDDEVAVDAVRELLDYIEPSEWRFWGASGTPRTPPRHRPQPANGKPHPPRPPISGGAGQKTRADPRFRPTKKPKMKRPSYRTAVDAYQAVTRGSPRAIFSLALRLAKRFTPGLYKDVSAAVQKQLLRIARILEEKGRPAALAAAYALVNEHREFRRWLENQEQESNSADTSSSRSGE